LNAAARAENKRALMVAAGLDDETASKRLDVCILVSVDPTDQNAIDLSSEVLPILSRTLAVASSTSSAPFPIAAEVILGAAKPVTNGPQVFVSTDATALTISRSPTGRSHCVPLHRLKQIIAACYIAGAAVRAAVGSGLANPPPDEFCVPFDAFVPASIDLTKPLMIGVAYLAGAGAIGNGFLWGARAVPIDGTLHIADDDLVSEGNLQRQIWFTADDVGKSKAERLAAMAQPHMPGCRLLPAACRLQEHPNRNDGPWLPTLIVGVDSRRARRKLQNELPGAVFDASTTGSQEIVLHQHRQPNLDACLGCVYPRDDREISHEEAIAQHLGVGVEQVREERIGGLAAMLICAKHPGLAPNEIEGLAYDSLYKQLCGSGLLASPSGSSAQVIAPFAFVSVLAGVAVLCEMIRRQQGTDETNSWRINPWTAPVPALRLNRPRRSNCECCGRPEINEINRRLWSNRAA